MSPAASSPYLPLVDDILKRLQASLGDRYAVEREVGRGGMATVYLATDLKHQRSVAIKVLLPELAASVGHDRFLQEIGIAAKLQHRHHLYQLLPCSKQNGRFACLALTVANRQESFLPRSGPIASQWGTSGL